MAKPVGVRPASMTPEGVEAEDALEAREAFAEADDESEEFSEEDDAELDEADLAIEGEK